MKTKIFCLALITAFYLQFCLAWRSFNFRFDSTECLQTNNMINFINCSIVKIKRNQEGFNMNLRFNQNIIRPQLDFMIITERPNRENFILANITKIDGCQFLENRETFNILQIIRKEFTKYSNIPDKCPVKNGTEINVKQLVVDSDNFPPYVPATNFRVIVLLREKSELILNLTVHGRVESKKRYGF